MKECIVIRVVSIQTGGQQFKEKLGCVCGVQSDFLSPFINSGGVDILEVKHPLQSEAL